MRSRQAAVIMGSMFEVALAEAEAKYRVGEFVVCPGEVQARRMAVCEPAGDAVEWSEF